MSIPTAKQSIRRVIVSLFPWLPGVVDVAGAKGKGLAIRTASGLLHLAGGPSDPAVHRVGDLGHGGTFTSIVPGQLTWTGPDGSVWNITLQSAAPGSPVVIALIPVTGSVGKIVTKPVTGSEWVTCK
jgi:hypothetical protein